MAQRVPRYARDRRSLHVPAHSLGRGDRGVPARPRRSRLSPRPAAEGRAEGARDGLHGEVRLRVRVLPLQGNAGVGARQGLSRPDAAFAGHVWLLLAARLGECPAGARSAGQARCFRHRAGGLPHRDRPGRVRGGAPLRRPAARGGQGGAVQDRRQGDLRAAWRDAVFHGQVEQGAAGCSGHLHQSLWTLSGEPAFHDPRAPQAMSKAMQHFVAGQIALMPAFTALIAPTINSYKRMVRGAWSPTMATWGVENRTTALRVIGGSPQSTRVEYRFAAADMNPYIAMAASIASGLYGIEDELPLPPETKGSGYEADGEALLAAERQRTPPL